MNRVDEAHVEVEKILARFRPRFEKTVRELIEANVSVTRFVDQSVFGIRKNGSYYRLENDYAVDSSKRPVRFIYRPVILINRSPTQRPSAKKYFSDRVGDDLKEVEINHLFGAFEDGLARIKAEFRNRT